MSPAGLEKARSGFRWIAARLAAAGGGLISIYYHPCEWVHQKFWDAVNFSRGANPPRKDWKVAAAAPAAETEAAFTRFGAYLDHMRASPRVQFVTASQLPKIYPDRSTAEGAADREVTQLAKALGASNSAGVDYQLIGDKAFSPADQFCLFCSALRPIDSS